jgi:hypothetical protein
MLSHIATDLHQIYLEEVFTPQLGKPKTSTSTKTTPSSSSDLDGDNKVDPFEKKVRQFIYDVRHLVRTKNIPVQKAVELRSSNSNYGNDVIKAAKEKLGIKGGPVSPVSEETKERMVVATINYKNGTVDRRNVPYNQVSELRSKPTVRSIEISSNTVSYPNSGEKYERNYGSSTGKNTVGDKDGDGTKEPNSHEYAGVKDNAIKKALGNKSKKKEVKEGFSNWRQDLHEITNTDDEIKSSNEKQIKEKKVDNYSGGKGKKVVDINPQFNESIENLGGYLIESIELNEEYINESIDIATDFFYNYGLNENGVDIVIEELGKEKFAEFVFDLSETYILIEERSAKKAKPKKSVEQLKKEIDDREAAKKIARQKVTADKAKKATETAKQTQEPSSQPKEKPSEKGSATSKKPVRDAIARGIFGAVDAYKSGMARHKKAMELAKETGKTVAKAAAVTHEAGRRAGESKVGQAVKKVGGQVVKAGVEKARRDIETTRKALKKEEFEQIDEILTKKTPVGKVIKDIVHSKDPKFSQDTKKQRINRALGAYYGMHPEKSEKKVDEGVSSIPGKSSNQQPETATTQRDTQKKQQQINAQKKTLMAHSTELAAKKAQLSRGVPLPNN